MLYFHQREVCHVSFCYTHALISKQRGSRPMLHHELAFGCGTLPVQPAQAEPALPAPPAAGLGVQTLLLPAFPEPPQKLLVIVADCGAHPNFFVPPGTHVDGPQLGNGVITPDFPAPPPKVAVLRELPAAPANVYIGLPDFPEPPQKLLATTAEWGHTAPKALVAVIPPDFPEPQPQKYWAK
jgi:hypothetical protein